MDAHLRLKNTVGVIGAASDFAHRWAIDAGLDPTGAVELSLAVDEVVTDVVLYAFTGEECEFEIAFRSDPYSVEVVVSELGEPFDPERHRYDAQRAVADGDFQGAGLELVHHLVDDFEFVNLGRAGKAFRLVKGIRSSQGFAPGGDAGSDEPPPPSQYTLAPVTPADAEDVAKLMYRTYGYTYANEDVYFPDRVALAFAGDEKFGVIVRAGDGRPVAYFAVLRPRDTAVGELTEVVVSPGHRGCGLMTRMLTALVEEARRQGLPALFGEAVTIHPITQRVNQKVGFQSTGLLLAHLPLTRYKGLAEDTPDAISAVVDYRLLKPVGRRELHLPARYATLLTRLYAALGVEVVARDPGPEPAARTDVDVAIAYHGKNATIAVRRVGQDVATRVGDAAETLRAKDVGTVFVDLPLDDPGTDGGVEVLARQGYVFGGLMPLIHNGRDHVRMQHVAAPPDFDRLATWSDLAAGIKDTIRDEVQWSTRGRTDG